MPIKKIIFVITLFIASFIAHAETDQENFQQFDQIFRNWTNAFNAKNTAASCDLFAKTIVADYQGVPQKNYDSICDGFQKIFQEPNRKYHYDYKLHDVYHSGDLASVRITWYLRIDEKGKDSVFSQDEGIDIFEKNDAGKWQIVNYIAYPHSQ